MGSYFIIPLNPIVSLCYALAFPFAVIFLKFHLFLFGVFTPLPSLNMEKESVVLQDDSIKVHATKNAVESNQWKLKLIEQAQDSILLSGCYCGGIIFDQTLDLLDKKLQNNPQFLAYILSSEVWLTEQNLIKIKKLSQKFPNQFFTTVTQEKNLTFDTRSNQIKISCNHVKCLVVDSGRAFMIGGSGLQDRWMLPGNEDIPKPELSIFQTFTKEFFAPEAFKDSDFIFVSKEQNTLSRQVYEITSKLIQRWAQVYPCDHFTPPPPVQEFSSDSYLVHDQLFSLNQAQVFLSSPEHTKSLFLKNLIESIDAAKESVYINHLYFHPPMELLRAVQRAAKRGVKVTLIINSDSAKAPGLNWLFTSLSKLYCRKLIRSSGSENISIYEFYKQNVTLHKKIIIVDSKYLFTGSSNLGYTSMRHKTDYEMDLALTSDGFSKHVLELLQEDQLCSNLITNDSLLNLSLSTYLLGKFQEVFEFLL